MARLTKKEIAQHELALAVLEKDVLTHEDKLLVFENWQESAENVNSKHGAFFTPWPMASEFTLEMVDAKRVVDLCAGIGTLSYAYWWHYGGKTRYGRDDVELTCVELNPKYVEVGRKILPEATWIEADIFDLPPEIGEFDLAVSNPPFGKIKTDGDPPNYRGSEFEYKVIDLAMSVAEYGAFIIPQRSSGFALSGVPYFRRTDDKKYLKFVNETGIHLDVGVGVDTSAEEMNTWHGVKPKVEFAIASKENI